MEFRLDDKRDANETKRKIEKKKMTKRKINCDKNKNRSSVTRNYVHCTLYSVQTRIFPHTHTTARRRNDLPLFSYFYWMTLNTFTYFI